ncbi:hypothetical protein CK203_010141 [Vitis vinifera]|uniref:DUF4219 domain-containing protein n=1 Tax=Vitis vinifera TaxID=29760 RepID=A0A438JXG7_VITVI|nr:hypothetical protein CK203_010141 [Vitis vinifera]
MVIPSSSSQTENCSKHRAPFFTGIDYPYWKARMTWFLQSTDLDVWDVIEDGPTFPTKLVDGVLVPKPKKEWNELDRRNFQLNAKAVYTLQCAMDRNEYNRICQCKSAKEIFRLLEITHEGTNQVKESKINILVHNYELFSMKDSESIVEMITRFTEIVNGLEALGRVINESKKVMKILSLTKQLQESEDKKKKSIALKATTKEEEDVEEEKPSEENDDLALITRNLNKYMRGERFKGKKLPLEEIPQEGNPHHMVTRKNGKRKEI